MAGTSATVMSYVFKWVEMLLERTSLYTFQSGFPDRLFTAGPLNFPLFIMLGVIS